MSLFPERRRADQGATWRTASSTYESQLNIKQKRKKKISAGKEWASKMDLTFRGIGGRFPVTDGPGRCQSRTADFNPEILPIHLAKLPKIALVSVLSCHWIQKQISFLLDATKAQGSYCKLPFQRDSSTKIGRPCSSWFGGYSRHFG